MYIQVTTANFKYAMTFDLEIVVMHEGVVNLPVPRERKVFTRAGERAEAHRVAQERATRAEAQSERWAVAAAGA